MNALFDILPPALLEPMAWALIHSLWQVTLIVGVSAIVLALLKRHDARLRYAVGGLGLLLSVLVPVWTALSSVETSTSPVLSEAILAEASPIALTPSATPAPAPRFDLQDPLQPYLPWLLMMWLFGMLLKSAAYAGGLVRLARLRRHTVAMQGDWPLVVARLAHRLKVHRPVRLLKSVQAPGPFVMGIFRPVIVMPAAAFSGMSTAELEAVLLHELAHVRRHDFFVNLLQVLAETLLFYHPGVWWLSKRIRDEREHCCDDLAVRAGDGALTYARALTHLEMLRPVPLPALSAGGGALLARIRRITQRNPSDTVGSMRLSVILILVALGIGSASLLASPAPDNDEPAVAAVDIDEDDEDFPESDLEDLRRAAQGTAWADLTASDLRRLTHCGFDEDLFQALHRANIPASAGQLRRLGCFGVDADDVQDLAKARVTDIDQLLKLARFGVDADDVLEFREAGLDLPLEAIIEFSNHGVDPEDIAQMRRLGYTDLTRDDILMLARHGVDADALAALKAGGFGNLTVKEIVGLARHGVDVEDIAEYLATGLDLGIHDIQSLARHGIDADDLNEFKNVGLENVSMEDVIRLARHGVRAEDFAGYRHAGLEGVSMKDVVTLARHGVDPENFAGYRHAGFGQLSMSDILTLARHGIDPEDAAALRAVGPQGMTVQQLVRLSNHGIDADNVAAMRALTENLTVDDVIRRARAGFRIPD